MRHPPPVAVTCSGGVPWRAAQALLAAAAAGCACAWLQAHLGDGHPSPALALAAALLAAATAWAGASPRPLALRWDGSAWMAADTPCRPEVAIDLGGWMLLRLRPARGPARWAAVAAGDAGGRWHGLRTALHARSAAPDPDTLRASARGAP
ncbi:hypothetical protein [Rubrivivax benzoatilyticus]|uniref:Toxin CptA n=1 Tax=Rubrivivax benzoatilyticus TaxID=316997 RepID=A0ABX0HX59_9BURK|nr:hypothetical protein [Rubrivivax benzoatilyticus]EGJ09939.1 hypothetical protein RBXJA2T_06410 [Rubrivivax benzoatilyticus JA2 = ATCC BAA-35]NHK97959.1 hypothetical protein [Rubrivivax benzoatilyticus]NHL23461.1 hypothetical protein [Rubrivivax benzoatilyticus]